MDIAQFSSFKAKITNNCSRVIVGKDDIIEQIAICLVCGGHVLLEDVPGTGKTMLLRAFAKSLGLEFSRIQFTPDILPSDLTGINFFNQKEGEFTFKKGPLFANMILADEINRAVPRSQAALLEVMEENSITVDGVTYRMSQPYMVMATQNPIENYGTFPLPEAQCDRFLMKLSMGYMDREQEMCVLRSRPATALIDELEQVITADEVMALRNSVSSVTVSDDVLSYMMDIVTSTRNSQKVSCGVSTRGARALYRACQVKAAFSGRNYVIPEDVKAEAQAVLSHRIVMSDMTHENASVFIGKVLEEVAVPLEVLK